METKKPIVYFASAITGDRYALEMMRSIVNFIKSLGHHVLTEHVVANDPNDFQAKELGKTKEELTVEDIENQDTAWLDTATHVIAEFSGASTGTGREIEYARTKGQLGKTPAKVLCLYQEGSSASPFIRGMSPEKYPNIAIKSYKTEEEVHEMVREFLES